MALCFYLGTSQDQAVSELHVALITIAKEMFVIVIYMIVLI
jgi:hypothetical protein